MVWKTSKQMLINVEKKINSISFLLKTANVIIYNSVILCIIALEMFDFTQKIHIGKAYNQKPK